MVTPERAFAIAREWRETMPLDVTRLWGNDAAEAMRDLASQVESLQADAERYRWLRDKADFLRLKEGSPQVCMTDEWGEIVSVNKSSYPQGEKLDAVVDEARKQS